MSNKKTRVKSASLQIANKAPITPNAPIPPKKEAVKFEIPVNMLDQAMIRELQKILTRTELKLDGSLEIKAANQIMCWVEDLEKRISAKVEEMQRYKKERQAAAMKFYEESGN